MNISTGDRNNVKVFEGWNEYNFEHYDNSEMTSSYWKYMYTPEGSGLFEADSNQATLGYEFFKKGYAGDGDGNGDIYFGTSENFVKLKYYNDVESVEEYIAKDGDKEYYGYQNIAKGVATKLDRVDSHEYEIEKQEWYVGYETKDTYDHLEKFNPLDPRPTIAGVNGVVETFDTDQEIKYHQFHIHKVCGLKLSDTCYHNGHANHTTTVDYTDVQTIEELETAIGYAVLVRDLDIANKQRALNLNPGLIGICLNGHTIMGDGRYGLLNINHAFNICDCKVQNNTGGITSDESFTQALDIININTSEAVGIYGLAIRDVAFDAGYALNIEEGNVFVDSITLMGCIKAGTNGVLRSAVNVNIGELVIINNNLSNANPLVRVTNSMNIHDMAIEGNVINDSIVIIDSDATIDNLDLNNNTSLGKGALYIAPSKSLTISEDVEVYDNKAVVGGALYVAGRVVVNNGADFAINKATDKGGAIYLADGGKVSVSGDVRFVGNSAETGGAIYAEKLTLGDLLINGTEFWSNKASSDGSAIAFGGELNVSNLTFKSGKEGATYISNINKTSALDKANISSISFIENTITGSAISLTNVKDG
ncbi:MAG: hypothetical protein IJ593_12290, partial [Lachnospiraceae bacterium]|nr:hypothetical protein [Lachnospiraceae bacterium]